MPRTAAILMAAAFSAGTLSGCSVGMALSGSHNPDLGAVGAGTSRGEVEMHLGSPIKSTMLEDGRRADVYEYEIGNEPSAGRAAGHAVMDVLTLGIWEIVGTPIEDVQGERFHATVVYDDSDRVIDLSTTKVAAAM